MAEAAVKRPRSPQALIDTPAGLAEVCAHLRAAGTFGFDMECDPRPSYRPRLCLVQVATTARVELLDPQALADLGPFWALLADPEVEKVCHAGGQDLAVAWQSGRQRPQNVFDCQAAAGLVGLGHQEAYAALVESIAGIALAKGETRSPWHQRPLSAAQLTYAVQDVQYLPVIHRVLRDRLEALARMSWMREIGDDLCAKAATDVDPRLLFADIEGAAKLRPRQQSVLRELAVLRDRLARERREPVRWVLDDKALLALAARGPETAAQLQAVRGVPSEAAARHGGEIVGAIRRGKELPPEEHPRLAPPAEDSPATRRLVEIMYAASQVICLGQSVAPGMVANKRAIEGLARLVSRGEDLSGHALMRGWTRECLGAPLVDFVRGETDVTLRATPERMVAEFGPRD